MDRYILALDQGTTSSRAIIFDRGAAIVDQENIEFEQIFPKPGWVEHNPEDILSSLFRAIEVVMKRNNITFEQLDSIGITNQRETAILWDKKSGAPVHNAIVWQCRRTSDRCSEIKSSPFYDVIYDKTGLIVDPYFSATKIEYLLHSDRELYAKAKRGELAFGTVDSWLIYNLTGGRHHVTDYSNASRTMLFNINSLKWDEEILDYFDIPPSILPELIPSSNSEIFTDSAIFSGHSIPIAGVAGDQQAALFGQQCFNEGDIKNTYGTGCFLLMNVGKRPVKSANRLLSTIGWHLNGETTYAMEGAVFIAGAVVHWLRDGLEIIGSSAESEALAFQGKEESVLFVPAFSGLGSPYWDPQVRGSIFGLTRDTGKADLVKAALESIAFQSRDLLEAMKSDFGGSIGVFRADGGASRNRYLMQFQADINGEPVYAANMAETTGLGTAFLAGLATGYYESMDFIKSLKAEHTEYCPNLKPLEAEARFSRWKMGVEAARMFRV